MIPLGQFRDTFIIAVDDEGIAIVDQHVAHERVLFERITERLTKGRLESQRMLEPMLVELPAAARQALVAHAPDLERLGFELEEFGGEALRVTAIPALLRRDQSAFYAEGPLCYSQAWSMVYFLRSSGEVARRHDWSEILPRYFDTLKTAFAEELDALAARSEPIQVQTYLDACGRSRTQALDTAFEGIDLAELETAWAAFVEALEPAPE